MRIDLIDLINLISKQIPMTNFGNWCLSHCLGQLEIRN